MNYSEYIQEVKEENKELIEKMIAANDETFEDFRSYHKMSRVLRLAAAKKYREVISEGGLSDDDRIIIANDGDSGKMYSFDFMDFSKTIVRELTGRAYSDLKSRNAK